MRFLLIFFVFKCRFGQKKPCYVYRFLASGTMEEKIYNRQVTKLSLSCRVVDEQQIERHYSHNALNELYKFEPHTNDANKPTLNLPKDRLLAEIFLKYKDLVENYHEHDSLLENKVLKKLRSTILSSKFFVFFFFLFLLLQQNVFSLTRPTKNWTRRKGNRLGWNMRKRRRVHRSTQ